MILANTYVATKIYKAFPDSALLRMHRSVEEDRFSDLREVLEAAGISFSGASNLDLASTLKKAKNYTNPTVNALFRSLATRAMSEAQYICTGESREGIDFSHYGLGLDYYTHFTSPIRRYADVVVHKQLLQALQRDAQPSPRLQVTGARRAAPTLSLPESNVISVMAGEGLDGDNDDDLIDSLIDGASELALGPDPEPVGDGDSLLQAHRSPPLPDNTARPYGSKDVARICEGLNLHTRLAKHSSFECQQLFLSLYFRESSEITTAVVVNLRINGFFAYIPRFDIRIPVYVRDVSDQVQLDPALLGLPPDAGLPATLGFSGLGSRCRHFPSGRCDLWGSPDERLEVSVPGAQDRFIVRPLDVVILKLTCEDWDARARVPSPRAQLLSDKNPIVRESRSAASASVQTRDRLDITSKHLQEEKCAVSPPSQGQSSFIAEALAPFKICPVVDELSTPIEKFVPASRIDTLGGRIVFGGFVNPDTRSAMQDAAQRNAATEAAERRQKVLEQAARRSEYDVTKRIERITTSRQQKLAAEKRNTRRSKAK